LNNLSSEVDRLTKEGLYNTKMVQEMVKGLIENDSSPRRAEIEEMTVTEQIKLILSYRR
jgi:hypothetical protein